METSSPAPGDETALRDLRLQRERVGFGIHFSAFVVVNAFVAVLNLLYTPGIVWFIFVLFPWGAGVAAHFIAAFYDAPLKAREAELRGRSSPGRELPSRGPA